MNFYTLIVRVLPFVLVVIISYIPRCRGHEDKIDRGLVATSATTDNTLYLRGGVARMPNRTLSGSNNNDVFFRAYGVWKVKFYNDWGLNGGSVCGACRRWHKLVVIGLIPETQEYVEAYKSGPYYSTQVVNLESVRKDHPQFQNTTTWEIHLTGYTCETCGKYEYRGKALLLNSGTTLSFQTCYETRCTATNCKPATAIAHDEPACQSM